MSDQDAPDGDVLVDVVRLVVGSCGRDRFGMSNVFEKGANGMSD